MLYLDVFANDMEEAIGGLSEVLGHDGVPFPQSEHSLANDGLRSAGQGTVYRRESRTSPCRSGGCRAEDRCGVNGQACARRRRLAGKRGKLNGLRVAASLTSSSSWAGSSSLTDLFQLAKPSSDTGPSAECAE